MSISLEGITLPDLVDELLFQWSGVRSTVDRTLDGSVIVWEQSQEGRPINLMGGSDWGFITHEWKGCSTKTIRLIVSGLVILALSTCIMGFGNYLAS